MRKGQPVWIVVHATVQIIASFLLPPALLLAPVPFLRLLGLVLLTVSALRLSDVNQTQMRSYLEARLAGSSGKRWQPEQQDLFFLASVKEVDTA